MRTVVAFLFLLFQFNFVSAQTNETYAEKLGFPKGAKVVIMHVDDMGMSFDSNTGGIEALTKGIASSCSVMMPCSWVPGFVQYLKENPEIDAGLHLTLTSEWKEYRWGPLSGKKATPGLVDDEGALYSNNKDVVRNASADEVEMEIRAQIDRALTMGFHPTHLDSHMGTIFASQEYIQRFIKVGIEYQIPIMFPGGHNTLITQEFKDAELAVTLAKTIGKMLWNAGLPVLDDLFTDTYSWKPEEKIARNDKKLRAWKTQKYIDLFHEIQPGITMVVNHATKTTDIFDNISSSGPLRRSDYLAMTDPKLRRAAEKEGIIFTTWRELMERRNALKNKPESSVGSSNEIK